MNAQDSRKLIVAIGMAAVVGVGVMTYAMRPHPVVHVAQAITPPAPLAEIPVAPAAVAAPPAAPATAAAVAPSPPLAAVPAAPAHKDVVLSKRTVTRNIDTNTSYAAEPDATTRPHAPAVVPDAVVPDLGMTVAAATVVAAPAATAPAATAPDTSSTSAATAAAVVPAPALASTPSPSAAADLKVDSSTAVVPALVATDSQITTEVKSEIAVDSQSKDAAIEVSTTNGVVALTGSLASQDAIEHVKIVVARVKDVKSVDTSALLVRNL